MLCSLFGIHNLVKMSLLYKSIHRFDPITNKIPVRFFYGYLTINIKCIWKDKGTRTAQLILKKNKV